MRVRLNQNSSFATACYIRLSREDGDKEESYSVENQRKLLMEYIKNKNDLVLYDMYVDDGFSGIHFSRPAFKRMMSDIEAGKVNCVIVKDLSRFGRDYIDTGRYLERIFPEKEVRFIAVTDGIDSFKRAYDMLLPIKNVFNEQYARDISGKVHASIAVKQKAGEFIGAFPSYGYKKSTANKNKLVIDEYAAGIVRYIFSLYTQGMAKQSIAKHLNDEGIPCPTEYKQLKGDNYKNHNKSDSIAYWTYSTIHNMLQNEIYIGNMVQGKKHQYMRSRQRLQDKKDWIVVRNTHEPIIDHETWQKTQLLLSKRSRKTGMSNNANIFAGFLKCGDCGRSMIKESWKKADGSKESSFYCGTYKRNGKRFCTSHALPMEVLESIILSDLQVIIENTEDIVELIKKAEAGKAANRNTDTEIINIEKQLFKIQNRKKSLYEDYKDNLIDKEEFVLYNQNYREKEQFYLKQIEIIKKQNCKKNSSEYLPWINNLLMMKCVENLDRDVVIEMIDEIVIYEDNRIRIKYKFDEKLENLFKTIYITD